MQILEYVIWALAGFFTISWTIGLILNPQFRLKPTVISVIYWNLYFWSFMLMGFTPFQLIWLMPLTLVLPNQLMLAGLKKMGTVSDFIPLLIGSSVALIPLYLLACWLAS